MAKVCDFCGKELGWGDVYHRNVGGNDSQLCETCAANYIRLQNQDNAKKITDSVWWAKEIVNKRKYNMLFENELLTQIADAERRVKILTGDTLSSGAAEGNRQAPVYTPNTFLVNNNSYNVSGGSGWIGILKIIAAITLVCAVIAGAAIGGLFLDEGGMIIGLLLGAVVGLVSISFVMVFANMAEDIKATREYTKQIRNMLDQKNNNK